MDEIRVLEIFLDWAGDKGYHFHLETDPRLVTSWATKPTNDDLERLTAGYYWMHAKFDVEDLRATAIRRWPGQFDGNGWIHR